MLWLEHLNKSTRSLRADLQLLNTTYEKVIALYRERLARRLLSQTDESIDQIVYLTGFLNLLLFREHLNAGLRKPRPHIDNIREMDLIDQA